MQIFQFLGSLCGYILWPCFLLVKNFGVAVIIFTIFFKVITIPLNVKQQKSMAATQRLSAKQQAIREKYANNPKLMNEEIQKLYDKENASPTSGCLTTFLPLLIMMGVFYSVAYPLSNTLHLDTTAVNTAAQYVNLIPGLSSSASSAYTQIEFIRVFPSIQNTEFIKGLFSAEEIAKISQFSGGFNFLGLDLLVSPSSRGFFSPHLIIPALCLITSIGSQLILQKLQGTMGQTKGCMAVLLYGMPLFTAYIAYTVPAAVGLYWIVSTVFSALSSIIMQRWYSAQMITAKSEAAHIALLDIQEKEVRRLR